jgi:hypothetical protein
MRGEEERLGGMEKVKDVLGVPPTGVEIRVQLCYDERHKLGAFVCPQRLVSSSGGCDK